MGSNMPATNNVTTIRDLLDRSKGQITKALPRHMNADGLLRIAMTSIQTNYRLLECDPKSLVGAVMEAAQLGLEPDGVLGRAYLVPYKVKGNYRAQLQIGYRGLVDLAHRSGQIASLYAHPVYENDEWDFEYGLEPKLRHVPARDDRGDLIAAYAVVRLKDGGYDFEWMWKSDIDKVRASSKASDSGPWVTHYDEMARKTPLRRLAKRIPLSTEFQRAAVMDEYSDQGFMGGMGAMAGQGGEIIDVEGKTQGKVAQLKQRLTEARQPTFREEWINLRAAGYSAYVHENLDRFREAEPKLQAEARDKWTKLYVGTPWPLDDQHREPEEPPTEPEQENTPPPMIPCPEREDTRVIPEKMCAECRVKADCQSYFEYLNGTPDLGTDEDGIPL